MPRLTCISEWNDGERDETSRTVAADPAYIQQQQWQQYSYPAMESDAETAVAEQTNKYSSQYLDARQCSF